MSFLRTQIEYDMQQVNTKLFGKQCFMEFDNEK